jgi:hypothetical protein
MSDERVHIYRPTPIAGVVIGLLVFAGIGLPGAIIAPEAYFAADGLAILIICALASFGLVLLALIRVECVRDDARRTITFTRYRWPLAPLTRVLSIDGIERVELAQRGAARVAVIVMKDGELIPLAGGKSSGSAHEDTATVIRSWLPRQSA